MGFFLHIDMQIHPVQNRARDPASVGKYPDGRAAAAAFAAGIPAAGAKVACSNQGDITFPCNLMPCPGYTDFTGFQWFPQSLQNVFAEFRYFIKEQNPTMGKGCFPGNFRYTNHCRRAGLMMG